MAPAPQRHGAAGTLAILLRVLGVGLLVWVGLWLAAALFFGAALWIVLLAVAAVLVHALVMALEFALMRRASRRDAAPVPTRAELLRAWGHEALGALWIFGWMLPWRSRRYADRIGEDAAGRRGLILVHGFVCNRGIWNPWLARLHALGVPCIALDLEPVFGAIEAYVPQIDAAVGRMQQATGLPPLLVAHSMGGLAVRAWLRQTAGDERIHGVVTVGTPHRGTWLARFGFAPNMRQMRLDGDWVRTLAAGEPPQRARLFTCFYGHCDNIVFPPAAATLPGADNRHMRATAHVHMLRHPAVLDEVLRQLGTGAEPEPPPGARLTGAGRRSAPAGVSPPTAPAG
jgi:triacylglycerol lipase